MLASVMASLNFDDIEYFRDFDDLDAFRLCRCCALHHRDGGGSVNVFQRADEVLIRIVMRFNLTLISGFWILLCSSIWLLYICVNSAQI